MKQPPTDIVLINRKSYIQLQEHFDDIVQSERLSKNFDPMCQQLTQLNQTMRETRQFVHPPMGRVAESIVYRPTGQATPFGAPTTFNPAITGHAVVGNNFNRQSVPWNVAAPPISEAGNNPLANFK